MNDDDFQAIDTLRYARELKNAGDPAERAEAMADAIASELVEGVATKGALERAAPIHEGRM